MFHRVRSGHEGFSDDLVAELIVALRASVTVYLLAESRRARVHGRARAVDGHMFVVILSREMKSFDSLWSS